MGRGGPDAGGRRDPDRGLGLHPLGRGRDAQAGRQVRVPRAGDRAVRRVAGRGRVRRRRRGPERRAPRGGHQELAGQPEVRRLPARGARVPRPLVRRAALGRPRPGAGWRGTRAVHLVVYAWPGLRQRRRLADRLSARHTGACRRRRDRRDRPRPVLGHPLERPRPPRPQLRPLVPLATLWSEVARLHGVSVSQRSTLWPDRGGLARAGQGVASRNVGALNPAALNASTTALVTRPTSSARTSAMAEPPKPPPVIRAPRAPAALDAPTARSSSAHETW